MTKDELLPRVATIIREHLGVDDNRAITLDLNFTEDFSADSLDMVELLMAFEEEFGIELPDALAQDVHTVGQAIDAIISRDPTPQEVS